MAAGMIAIDVVATETLEARDSPTITAAAIASTAVTARITSSTAIACQAVRSFPPTEYQGRKSETSIATPPIAASQSPLLSRRGCTRCRLNERCPLKTGGFDGVGEQHRDRHRPDAAGHRGDGGCLLRHRPEVDVTNEPLLRPVRADVDDDRTLADHLGGHELGAPHSCHEHIRPAADLRQVACAGMAHRDRRV